MFTVFEAEVGNSSELWNELSRPPTTHSDDLRKELNWTTLEARRNMNRSCLVYKCVRSQVPLSSRFDANKERAKWSICVFTREEQIQISLKTHSHSKELKTEIT